MNRAPSGGPAMATSLLIVALSLVWDAQAQPELQEPQGEGVADEEPKSAEPGAGPFERAGLSGGWGGLRERLAAGG